MHDLTTDKHCNVEQERSFFNIRPVPIYFVLKIKDIINDYSEQLQK